MNAAGSHLGGGNKDGGDPRNLVQPPVDDKRRGDHGDAEPDLDLGRWTRCPSASARTRDARKKGADEQMSHQSGAMLRMWSGHASLLTR